MKVMFTWGRRASGRGSEVDLLSPAVVSTLIFSCLDLRLEFRLDFHLLSTHYRQYYGN